MFIIQNIKVKELFIIFSWNMTNLFNIKESYFGYADSLIILKV